MNFDVTADETASLTRLLRRTIAESRYPLSPPSRREPPPPLSAYDAPSGPGRRRRRG